MRSFSAIFTMSANQGVIGGVVVMVVGGLAMKYLEPQVKKLEPPPPIDMSVCKKQSEISAISKTCVSADKILEDYANNSRQAVYRYQNPNQIVTILGRREITECFGLGRTNASKNKSTPCIKFTSGLFSKRTVACNFPQDGQLRKLAASKYDNKTISLAGRVTAYEKNASVVRLSDCWISYPSL